LVAQELSEGLALQAPAVLERPTSARQAVMAAMQRGSQAEPGSLAQVA